MRQLLSDILLLKVQSNPYNSTISVMYRYLLSLLAIRSITSLLVSVVSNIPKNFLVKQTSVPFYNIQSVVCWPMISFSTYLESLFSKEICSCAGAGHWQYGHGEMWWKVGELLSSQVNRYELTAIVMQNNDLFAQVCLCGFSQESFSALNHIFIDYVVNINKMLMWKCFKVFPLHCVCSSFHQWRTDSLLFLLFYICWNDSPII